MSVWTATSLGLRAGIWQLRVEGPADGRPDLSVRHLDRALEVAGVEPAGEPGHWHVRVALPPEALSDGVQTFQLVAGDALLATLQIVAGLAVAPDIRAELDLLRAELDVLRAAFRRHCAAAGD